MALRSPVVVRMQWVRGNAAGAKGAANAKYIAEREGVVRVEEPEHDRGGDQAEYMADRPGSTGLFGPDPQAPPELADVQEAVRAAPWHWQVVLSLRNDDARLLGVTSLDDWHRVTRNVLPTIAKKLQIEEGLRWVAAMHYKPAETSRGGVAHNHVHILAWVEGQTRNPFWTRDEIRQVKRVVAQEVYQDLRSRVNEERAMRRDLLISFGRDGTHKAERLIRRNHLQDEIARPEPDHFTPPLPEAAARELGEKVEHLANRMPGHGQAKLAFLPPEAKREAREIADWLLARPECAEALQAFRAAVRAQTEFYVREPGKVEAAWQRAYTDLRDRVAQPIVRLAAQANRAGQHLKAARGTQEKEDSREEERADAQPERGSREPDVSEPERGNVAETMPGLPEPDAEWTFTPEDVERYTKVYQNDSRLFDPAGALAHLYNFELTKQESRELTELLRQVEATIEVPNGRRPDGSLKIRIEASGPNTDRAVAFVTERLPVMDGARSPDEGRLPKRELEELRHEVAIQAVRQQGLHPEQEMPEPVDVLIRAAQVDLDEQTREAWVELLRSVPVGRGADGRLNWDSEALFLAVQPVLDAPPIPGREENRYNNERLTTEFVLQAYRQQGNDWREHRHELHGRDALAQVMGVPLDSADRRRAAELLRCVEVEVDWRTGEEAQRGKRALNAHGPGYQRAVRELQECAAPTADRFRLERETIYQAFRLQTAEARAEPRLYGAPEALARLFGLDLTAEDRTRVNGWLNHTRLSLDADGRWQGEGEAFQTLVGFVNSRCERRLFDTEQEVALQAARHQEAFAEVTRKAVRELAQSAGVTFEKGDAERWADALHGLDEVERVGGDAAAVMAERVGVTLNEEAHDRWTETLMDLPAWAKEPERTPVDELAERFHLVWDDEQKNWWKKLLRDLPVYRDDGGRLAAEPVLLGTMRDALHGQVPDAAPNRLDAEIIRQAYRQQQPDRSMLAELAGRLGPVDALGTYVGRDMEENQRVVLEQLLQKVEVYRDPSGYLHGRGEAYDAALDLLVPEVSNPERFRLGEEVARQAERVQTRHLVRLTARNEREQEVVCSR